MSAHPQQNAKQQHPRNARRQRRNQGSTRNSISATGTAAVELAKSETRPRRTTVPRNFANLPSRRREPAMRAQTGPIAVQSLSQLPSSSRAILRGILLPEMGPPVRRATGFSTSYTAVGNPNQQIVAGWSNNSAPAAGRTLNTDQMVGFAFRNPLRSLVLYDYNQVNANYVYTGFGVAPSVSGTPQIPANTWTQPLPALVEAEFNIRYFDTVSVYQPHGPRLYCATVDGDQQQPTRFFWLNIGDTFQVSYTVGATDVVTWYVDTFGQNGFTRNSASGAALTNSQTFVNIVTPSTAGYYSVSYIGKTGNSATSLTGIACRINNASGGETWCHRAVKDLEKNLSSVESVSVHAHSLRYCNDAGQAFRAGEIVSYQVPEEKMWFEYITAQPYATLAGEKQAKGKVSNEKGWFHALKPSDETDLSPMRYFHAEQGVLYDSYYPLNNTCEYIAMAIRAPLPTSSSVGTAQSGFFESFVGLEYATDDVWRDVRKTTFKPAEYLAALQELTNIETAHENPFHLGALLGVISKIANGVVTYGPRVIDFAKSVSTLLNPTMAVASAVQPAFQTPIIAPREIVRPVIRERLRGNAPYAGAPGYHP